MSRLTKSLIFILHMQFMNLFCFKMDSPKVTHKFKSILFQKCAGLPLPIQRAFMKCLSTFPAYGNVFKAQLGHLRWEIKKAMIVVRVHHPLTYPKTQKN